MNTRGLIVLNLGYDLGILSPRIFAMLVLMALVTTFMTGPLLSLVDWFRERRLAVAVGWRRVGRRSAPATFEFRGHRQAGAHTIVDSVKQLPYAGIYLTGDPRKGCQMVDAELPQRVEAVRRFNRFYTQQIGVLHEGLVKTPFSLTEGRVLWELAHCEETTAAGLGRELGLDAGYLSRILNGFQKQGLIDRRPSEADGRQSLLRLTERGRKAFAVLDGSTRAEIAAMLGGLSAAEQGRLIRAMETIRELLDPPGESKTPYLIRTHQPGDMGWVVHRHGVLYAGEYGWDERFEALIAKIVAQFIESFDPQRERCWIAEKDGEVVGSVFLVQESETVAKLRLLLVEPKARGLGLGGRLVDECIRFARRAGYRTMVLWTNDVLVAARRIYEKAGFRLVHEEPHRSFGPDLVGQTWELEL